MDLLDGTGRWIWNRDINYHEFVQAEMGAVAGAAAYVLDSVGRVPEHTFSKEEDGRIKIKVVNKFTPEGGTDTWLVANGEVTEGDVDVPGQGGQKGGKWTGTSRTLFEGDALNTYTKGIGPGPEGAEGVPFEFNLLREFKDGEYWLTMHNVKKDNQCSRIFTRYPYYHIVNETGQVVTLKTYGASDFVCFVASMTVEIEVGRHLIEPTDADIEEEQAVFTLPDGRSYSGINLKAFEKVVLKEHLFE